MIYLKNVWVGIKQKSLNHYIHYVHFLAFEINLLNFEDTVVVGC
jgi:hypothetical protein